MKEFGRSKGEMGGGDGVCVKMTKIYYVHV